MMRHRLLVIGLLAMFVFSCSQDNGSNLESATLKDFEVKDSLVLKLDETTSFESHFIGYHNKDSIILINRVQNNLVIFDDNGDIKSKVFIDERDSHNSSLLGGYYIVNKDSFIVNNFYNYYFCFLFVNYFYKYISLFY